MKKILAVGVLSFSLLLSATLHAQDDKSKRPSPPATVTQKLESGATITIDYSQPSLKGRTIGKDVEPMKGQVWRAGANEATVFQTDKNVTINGKKLAAGKYALFMTDNGTNWTVIFNKTWKTWGAFDYEKNKAQDALQITVEPHTATASQEKLTYTIDKSGKVSLLWGDRVVDFTVK